VSAYLSALPSISDSTEAQILLSHNLYFEEPQQPSDYNSLLEENSTLDSASTSLPNKRNRDESCEIIEEYLNNNNNNKSISSLNVSNDTNDTNSNSNTSSSQKKRPRLETIVID
jgi:hypothetical protein